MPANLGPAVAAILSDEACAAGWEELRGSIVYLMTASNVDEDEDDSRQYTF